MIRIISFKICPFVQRVTGALAARDVPIDIDYISLKDKPDWFTRISPTGQVPVLITEAGTALFESDAIAEYVEEIAGPLIDGLSAEDRAKERAWSYQASKHYLVQCGAMQSADWDILGERSAKLGKAFARAEDILGDGPFFNGNSLGNVDIAWLPLLHRAKLVEDHSGYDFLERYPKVKAWQTALLATGLQDKTVSADFTDRFSEFYLSDRTHLGRKGKTGGIEATDCRSSCCG